MSNENKINKLKEYIKTLVSEVLNEQDNETPSHFGGGENINVFGYDTKHFDICKSAVILFEKLILLRSSLFKKFFFCNIPNLSNSKTKTLFVAKTFCPNL